MDISQDAITHFDKEKAVLMVNIHREASQLFGDIKLTQPAEYVKRIVQMFQDKGLEAAVVLITDVPAAQLDNIALALYGIKFQIPVSVSATVNGKVVDLLRTKKAS